MEMVVQGLERVPVTVQALERVLALALEFVTVHVTEPVPEYATEQVRGLALAQEREAATEGVDANQTK